ncbi:hypothetical protein [Streptosporangium minutum]|uniref:Uncharacterized protein n=1 Tax=Streptosporangium minutum TaxID=569862 RepID=A0A243RRR5_9ACTN|nr:hypothetical protein [Streptosporangium minutum]OUC97730.1 hypothetical protein CA984_09955 [Streptosporangium minutum]
MGRAHAASLSSLDVDARTRRLLARGGYTSGAAATMRAERDALRGHHIPDYNGHYDAPATNCRLRCPLAQHQVCADAVRPQQAQVRQLLHRLRRDEERFTITNATVVIHGALSAFERTFLRQNLLYPVHTAPQAAKLIAGRLR